MCPKPDGGNTITANEATTARGLAAYRDELLELNFHSDLVAELVRDAAHGIVTNRELKVRISDDEPLTAEDQAGNGFVISENHKVINYLGQNYLAYDDWNAAKLAESAEAPEDLFADLASGISEAVEAVEKLTGVSIAETVEKLFGGPLYEDVWLAQAKLLRHSD